MNIYLLQLIGKWLNILLVAILSSTGFIDYTEETKDIILKNKDTSLTVESTVVKFETVTKYNDNLTTDIKNVLVEGQDGLVFVDEKGNIVKTVKEKVDEVIEIGTKSPYSYLGTLTGYGPDCIGCTGNVACHTKYGGTHNLYNSTTYNDETYGEVNILAAYLPEFPCGTIIEISDASGYKEYGVVLDTGGAMMNAWNRGQVLIDFAFSSEGAAYTTTRYNVTFDVLRFGW